MQENRKREIRIKTDSFRSNCKISKYGIIDLFKECDKLGYKLLRYPLDENAVLGFTVKKEEDIIIFTNSSSRLSREIFTLAHEIGHILLHLVDENPFMDDNVTISDKNSDEKEQEANYFAASLLMPSEDILRFIDLEIPNFPKNGLTAMDIARMMSEFNVSFDMTLNRLESLGIIDSNQKLRLDNEKIEKKVGNLLRNSGGNARLNVASKEINIPYEYIDYAIYNYNHNAIPQETLEKVLNYYHLSMEDISDKLITYSYGDDDNLEDLIGGLDD